MSQCGTIKFNRNTPKIDFTCTSEVKTIKRGKDELLNVLWCGVVVVFLGGGEEEGGLRGRPQKKTVSLSAGFSPIFSGTTANLNVFKMCEVDE